MCVSGVDLQSVSADLACYASIITSALQTVDVETIPLKPQTQQPGTGHWVRHCVIVSSSDPDRFVTVACAQFGRRLGFVSACCSVIS